MNQYQISYTLITFHEKKKPTTEHKTFQFCSEYDLLAAADDGMSHVYEENPNVDEIIFRKVELMTAKEFYQSLVEARNATA